MEVKSPAPPQGSRSKASGGSLSLHRDVPGTFAELLDRSVRSHGDRVFLPRRSARVHEPITFATLRSDVVALAAGLHDLGIRRGERIGLLAENCYEWLLADLGSAYLGAVDVPRGSDTSPTEMAFILGHSGSVAAFVADDRTGQTVLEARSGLPALRHVITLQDRTSLDGVLTQAEVIERGRRWLSGDAERLAPHAAAVTPDDLLTIVYTSGTTADPKGVMLTHRNVLSNVKNVWQVLHVTSADRFLSALPAWHMYERIMDYLALAAGSTLLYTERRRIKEDLRNESPSVFAAVPRIWETIHDGIIGQAHKMPGLKGKVFRMALDLCRRAGGRRVGPFGRLLHGLCHLTVLRPIRALTGGRLRLAVSGGGALPRHVDECLLGLGLPLLNGYGLTETSPVTAVRRPERNGPGHIGPPIPETQVEVRNPEGRTVPPGTIGILWIHGPQVMQGYFNNPEKTAAVLDEGGWFNSGDLGRVDSDGHLWITGRAKDTIVLAGGENVEPEPLETLIKTSPFIEQAVVVGQDRKCLGAVLVPDVECLEQNVPRGEWGEQDGWLAGDTVQALMRKELDRMLTRQSGCRPCERVAAFRVRLEPLTVENGMLTPTMKIRRHVVYDRMAAQIDGMFGGAVCET